MEGLWIFVVVLALVGALPGLMVLSWARNQRPTLWVDGPQTCADCDYDLTGLPRTAPCPECGSDSRRIRIYDPGIAPVPAFTMWAVMTLTAIAISAGLNPVHAAGVFPPLIVAAIAYGTARLRTTGLSLTLGGLIALLFWLAVFLIPMWGTTDAQGGCGVCGGMLLAIAGSGWGIGVAGLLCARNRGQTTR